MNQLPQLANTSRTERRGVEQSRGRTGSVCWSPTGPVSGTAGSAKTRSSRRARPGRRQHMRKADTIGHTAQQRLNGECQVRSVAVNVLLWSARVRPRVIMGASELQWHWVMLSLEDFILFFSIFIILYYIILYYVILYYIILPFYLCYIICIILYYLISFNLT